MITRARHSRARASRTSVVGVRVVVRVIGVAEFRRRRLARFTTPVVVVVVVIVEVCRTGRS
jgi:hypothetical protein